jgi:hypothetical protein
MKRSILLEQRRSPVQLENISSMKNVPQNSGIRLWPVLIMFTIITMTGCNLFTENNWWEPPIEGSGTLVTENRTVGSFTAVNQAGTGTVNVTLGAAQSVSVRVDDNVMEYLETVVSDGEITVYFSHAVRDVDLTVDIVMTSLTVLTLSGSGDLAAEGTFSGSSITSRDTGSGKLTIGTISTDSFNAEVSGSGDMVIGNVDTTSGQIDNSGSGNLSLSSLTVTNGESVLSGSGNIIISDGTADTWIFQGTGSGSYLAADFECTNAEVELSGSGSAYIRAVNDLDVTILGSGSVHYSGTPTISVLDTGSGNLLPSP